MVFSEGLSRAFPAGLRGAPAVPERPGGKAGFLRPFREAWGAGESGLCPAGTGCLPGFSLASFSSMCGDLGISFGRGRAAGMAGRGAWKDKPDADQGKGAGNPPPGAQGVPVSPGRLSRRAAAPALPGRKMAGRR